MTDVAEMPVRGLSPAVRVEQERRRLLDENWDRARKVANELVDSTGKKDWISTHDFLLYVTSHGGVDRTTAVLILDEFKSNRLVTYVLGKGIKHPAATLAE